MISFYKFAHILDEGKAVDVVFCFLMRLLILFSHNILLDKLSNCGMHVHSWENWLKVRGQRVLVNGAASVWCLAITGVPQGSVLGLFLFYKFISALETAGECNITPSLLKVPNWEVLLDLWKYKSPCTGV